MTNNIKVIFEDENLLAIDKPPGLVVDKSETQSTNTIENWLEDRKTSNLKRGGIVHRLDKDTSGILLIAKTQEALENLQSQFKNRKTKKEYLALVHGLLEKGGVVEGGIERNPLKREKFMVSGSGKEAVTEYEPIRQCQMVFQTASGRTNVKCQIFFSDFNKIQLRKLEKMKYNQFTLLKCFPRTGRTHQIRVHLKYINHPIVADEKYAGRKMVRLDKRWCPRLFLHAQKLGFYHPKTGEWMEMESKLPKDLEKALNCLSS